MYLVIDLHFTYSHIDSQSHRLTIIVIAIVLVIVTVIVMCEAVPDKQSYVINSNITNHLLFVPKYNHLPFCITLIPSPVVANLIKSGVADKAALGFLLAVAFPILLAVSNALTELLGSYWFISNFFFQS